MQICNLCILLFQKKKKTVLSYCYPLPTANNCLMNTLRRAKGKQRSGQEERRRRRKGCVTFWNAPWDPRVPPPRTLLSKHYHILQGDAVTTGLFPRKNLMSSGRRLQNLGELLSPTDQGGGRRGQGGGAAGGGGGGAGEAGGAGGRGGQRRRARPHPGVQGPQAGPRPGPGESGTLHCDQFGTKRGCDTCSHMVESSTIYSHFRKKHFGIHGRNIHLKATEKQPLKWFIYCLECLPCQAQYIGSTILEKPQINANTRKGSS